MIQVAQMGVHAMRCAHGVNGRDRAYKFVCHVPRFEKLSRGTGQLNSSLQSGGGSSNLKVRSLTKEYYKGGLQFLAKTVLPKEN